MNIETLLNQAYNANKISGDTFSVEIKNEKTDIAIKLVISKINKNNNPAMKVFARNADQNTAVIYQKVNSVAFDFLAGLLSKHIEIINEYQKTVRRGIK